MSRNHFSHYIMEPLLSLYLGTTSLVIFLDHFFRYIWNHFSHFIWEPLLFLYLETTSLFLYLGTSSLVIFFSHFCYISEPFSRYIWEPLLSLYLGTTSLVIFGTTSLVIFLNLCGKNGRPVLAWSSYSFYFMPCDMNTPQSTFHVLFKLY
jgi:hypothetical protein